MVAKSDMAWKVNDGKKDLSIVANADISMLNPQDQNY